MCTVGHTGHTRWHDCWLRPPAGWRFRDLEIALGWESGIIRRRGCRESTEWEGCDWPDKTGEPEDLDLDTSFKRVVFLRALFSCCPYSAMLQPRGRSRQVSNTALARQASEERRTAQPCILTPIPVKTPCPPSFIHSASPSPPSSASMSPDYYSLPASPPPTLEDQVHVAYALDDIHLAKILLLRLKGIEVTSDDDPRIAAVQDEDFDFCFVPNGGLMDDRDEKAIKEMQTKELERLEERRRFERLRTCERIWDDQKRRLREERLAVFRQRERKWMEEEDRRRSVEHPQQRHEERHRVQKAAFAERAAQRTRARLVCYDNLPTAPEKRPGQQFVYDVMFHSPSSRVPNTPSLSYSRSHLCGPIFDDSRSIPFSAVLASMQGPLFPVSTEDLDNRLSTSRSTSRTHSHTGRRRKSQLLETLLVEIQWPEDDRRNRKGKEKAHLRRSPPCLACSIASSPTSPLSPAHSASSSLSRTSSWLSFAGSSPSTSTDPSTPPTSPTPSISSPKSGWFKSSRAPRPKSWISTSNLLNPRDSSLRHSCNPHCRFTPVSSSESPLPLNPTHSVPIPHDGHRRSTGTIRAAEGAGLLVRVSRFMEMAKEFQHTYVNLAISNSPERESRGKTGSRERCKCGDLPEPNPSMHNSRLKEPGYRVSQCDVTAFLSVSIPEVGSSSEAGQGLDTTIASISTLAPPPRYIPLRQPLSSNPPRTILPDPLPYRRVFKPLPMPIRSPFRCHALSELHTTYPSVSDPSSFINSSSSNPFLHHGPLTWRIRSVENPVYLRLKALHNVVWKSGMVWQGRGRDTALGGGRERVVGVAYDGVGRSSLSSEIIF